jgi:hypothetical protein
LLKCFLTTLLVQLIWQNYVGQKGSSALPAKQILPLGMQVVAASLASFAAIKRQSLQGRSLIRHGHH